MTMRKLKFILALTVATFTALTVHGQELYRCNATQSYWTFEKDNSFFAVSIVGKVSKQERKNVIAVNDYALQYVIVDKQRYLMGDSKSDDLKVLTNYALSEAEYMPNLFKQKLDIEMEEAPLSADKTVLIWFFEMPSTVSQEVKHQVFANIIVGDKIFGLSSPRFADQELDDVKDFLMDVISTLKVIKKENDFGKLCRQ
jgi:hypothetical protein